jgi:hypothetical protein
VTQQAIHDDSVYAPSGHVANANATINDKSKGWMIAALISFNLLGTFFMFQKWRDAAMESRLQQYNLDWFKAHEFTELNTRVAVLAALTEGESKCHQVAEQSSSITRKRR